MDKRRSRLLELGARTQEPVRLTDIIRFPRQFWLICIICVSYYVTIFPFVSLGQVFFMKKFQMSSASANFINGLIYLISAFASPIFGFIIDRTGRNIIFVFTAVAATMVGHGLLAFTFINPYIGVSIMGLSYSLLASSLWPMITFVVPQHQLGTAFGKFPHFRNRVENK